MNAGAQMSHSVCTSPELQNEGSWGPFTRFRPLRVRKLASVWAQAPNNLKSRHNARGQPCALLQPCVAQEGCDKGTEEG